MHGKILTDLNHQLQRMPDMSYHIEATKTNAGTRKLPMTEDVYQMFKDILENRPHVCRHIYCSNQARAGMNPKTLQYLMGHSEIGVTMNTYTHLGLDDAKDETVRLEELEQARKEIEKASELAPMRQKMFRAI